MGYGLDYRFEPCILASVWREGWITWRSQLKLGLIPTVCILVVDCIVREQHCLLSDMATEWQRQNASF